MFRRHRVLQALNSLGLGIWLPLPLLGLLFWIGGGVMTDYLLSRSYAAKEQFQADNDLLGRSVKVVQSIQIQINRNRNLSRVKVKTASSALKEMEFEFPTTQPRRVEALVAQELGLSADEVRQLVQYQPVSD